MNTAPGTAKQQGTTKSERFTASLCERSFLALWSYPNVYRDQGKAGTGQGKELCDLLAVFGDDVFIFSDKDCSFPQGSTEISWRRWYKRTIQEAARQLAGAERWLHDYPTRLYLDRQCQHPFPIDLPPKHRMKVHRIVVASGAGEACRQFFGGGSGSLMLCPNMLSPMSETKTSQDLPNKPFVIGKMSGPFIHIFDDATLPIVMNELDTVADFTSFLIAKENFVSNDNLLLSAGEEHLLAFYLTNLFATGQSELPRPPDGQKIAIDESFWPSFITDPAYQTYQKRVQPSYVWDKIMQELSDDILADRMAMGNNQKAADHERRVRALASAPRYVRADLVLTLLPLIRNDEFPTRFRAVQHPLQQDTAYLLLVLTNSGLANEPYRRTRIGLLQAYCMCFTRHHPETRHIVGISTGPSSMGDDRSHEVVYIDRAEWTNNDELIAKQAEHDFGIFKNVTYRRTQ